MLKPEPTPPSAPKRETIDPSVGHDQRTGVAAGAAPPELEDRAGGLAEGRATGGGVERAAGAVADGEERVVVEARGGVDGGVEAEVAGTGAAAT